MRRALLGSLLAASVFLAAGAATAGDRIEFDLAGNGGFGALPANEIGAQTPVGLGLDSAALGFEIGDGFVYDPETMELSFAFRFRELSGALFDAASGIHLHEGVSAFQSFFATGPIVLNLNSGADPAVELFTPLLPVDGTTFDGTVRGVAVLSDEIEAALFAGRLYLNIHSGDFTGGDIRANLVRAPEDDDVRFLPRVLKRRLRH